MKVVATLSDMISSTLDWISWSVMRLMCPFCTKEEEASCESREGETF